ncbi:TPA: hypothetical protein N0F65_001060 [Lagenidium giganteum]|uniref:Uncharacterized protein n=1 Tax=Lagenidium giganteum TaxID=4803 RepID=A0AAV2YLC2_9STRA|nr:TPA: hypothetical protein N0F65_001060 [Lagenidium giganteum]
MSAALKAEFPSAGRFCARNLCQHHQRSKQAFDAIGTAGKDGYAAGHMYIEYEKTACGGGGAETPASAPAPLEAQLELQLPLVAQRIPQLGPR